MTDKESDTGRFYTNYRFEYPNENVVVATSSFQSVPSNKLPLINLTMNGILRPSEEKVYEIKMIFEGDIPEKDTLAQSYGTFVLCKGVYNARKIIKTAWDKEKSTLIIIIDLRREKVRLKRPAQFSFSLQIDDESPNPNCSEITRTCAGRDARCSKTVDGYKITPFCGYKPQKCCAGLKCDITLTSSEGTGVIQFGKCKTPNAPAPAPAPALYR
jgi:hypothetical protein